MQNTLKSKLQNRKVYALSASEHKQRRVLSLSSFSRALYMSPSHE